MMIKEITFITENCESITFDGRYICEFYLSDIQTIIKRVAANAIDKIDVANTFAIEIASGANGPYNSPFNNNKFNRILSYHDITLIQLTMYDQYDTTIPEEKYEFYINWESDDGNDELNILQDAFLSELGNLYIVIAKDSREVFFDTKLINNREYIEMAFEMCDIPKGGT